MLLLIACLLSAQIVSSRTKGRDRSVSPWSLASCSSFSGPTEAQACAGAAKGPSVQPSLTDQSHDPGTDHMHASYEPWPNYSLCGPVPWSNQTIPHAPYPCPLPYASLQQMPYMCSPLNPYSVSGLAPCGTGSVQHASYQRVHSSGSRDVLMDCYPSANTLDHPAPYPDCAADSGTYLDPDLMRSFPTLMHQWD